VVQVLDITRIFPIPGAPEYIVGALPVRGKIIPAIDLAKVYNIERLNYSDKKLLVIDVKNEQIGILSDIAPFFVSFESDIVVEDFIDPEQLFERLKVNSQKIQKIGMINKSELIKYFLLEADECVNTLIEAIEELEKKGYDKEAIEALFRVTHTLKGSASIVKFDKIAELSHKLEDLFEALLNQELNFDNSLISHIKKLLI